MNNEPNATLSLDAVQAAADLLILTWADYPTPSLRQIASVVTRYCDDPSITATDQARIRTRIEQHFNL